MKNGPVEQIDRNSAIDACLTGARKLLPDAQVACDVELPFEARRDDDRDRGEAQADRRDASDAQRGGRENEVPEAVVPSRRDVRARGGVRTLGDGAALEVGGER